jgi:hypothetical protein
MFGEYVDTYKHQAVVVDLMDGMEVDQAKLQNAGNTIWYPVQQHRPVLKGFDLTGQEQGIIEETVPISLNQDPSNDFIEQRIDDMRDMRFWERAGKQSAMQQLTDLNQELTELIVNTGSLYYEFDSSSNKSGFDFTSVGQAIIDEREVYDMMGRCFLLNPRDLRTFSGDLAGRQTLGSKADRSERAYAEGNVGDYVASFDIYKGSFLPKVSGSAITETTVSSDVSLKPEAGSVNATTKVVTNIDYREGSIPVTSSAAYAVGDVIGFDNSGTLVESIGLASKQPSGQQMTFKVVGIPDGTTLTVFPKPIALDDPALTELEKAYANIDTQILSGATVNKLNTANAQDKKANIFWAKDSIKMVGGDVPWQLMSEFDGNKVLSEELAPGITAYMVYDGNIASATFRYRIFVWYGLSNFNPMANGVGVVF